MSIQSFVFQSRRWFLSILISVSLLSSAMGASAYLADGALTEHSVGEYSLPALANDHQGSTGSG